LIEDNERVEKINQDLERREKVIQAEKGRYSGTDRERREKLEEEYQEKRSELSKILCNERKEIQAGINLWNMAIQELKVSLLFHLSNEDYDRIRGVVNEIYHKATGR